MVTAVPTFAIRRLFVQGGWSVDPCDCVPVYGTRPSVSTDGRTPAVTDVGL
jgi:hypothetical protein